MLAARLLPFWVAALAVLTAPHTAVAQTTLDNFDANAISTANWTVGSTKSSLTLVEANRRLEFRTTNDASATAQESNYAMATMKAGIGSNADVRAQLRYNFTRQTPVSAASASTGMFLNLSDVDQPASSGGNPSDGLMIGIGSYVQQGVNYRAVFVDSIDGGNRSTLYYFYGTGTSLQQYLPTNNPAIRLSLAEGAGNLFVSYTASTGVMRISFASFTDPNAMQIQANAQGRPIRLALGGYTGGPVKSLSGSGSWFDDLVLQQGTLSHRPTGLTASKGTSASAVTLTWTATPGATSYNVYRSNGTLLKSAVTATSYSDTSAAAGQLSSYIIRANSAAGLSEASAVAQGWRNISPPAPLTASDGSSTSAVNLSWPLATGAGSYKIFRGTSASNLALLATVGVLSYSDTTAVAGTVYTYSVKAVSGQGDSLTGATNTGWRNVAAPGGVAATDGSSTANVTVTWNAVTGATGYKVFRAQGSAAATQIGTTTSSVRTFADTTAVAGTIYTYSVKVVTAAGDSAASATNTGYRRVSPPLNVAATDTRTDRIRITWSAVTGATGYKVYRGTSASSLTLLGSATSTSYNDTSATPGVTYTYRVAATSAAGDSVQSASDTGLRPTSARSGTQGETEPDGLVRKDREPGLDRGIEGWEEAEPWAHLPLGAERYRVMRTHVMQDPPACEASAQDETVDPSDAEGVPPDFIDADEDGQPDLCQLLAGDLDLSGEVDQGDLSILLTLLGTDPFEGIGDLNRDGQIDATDLQELAARVAVGTP